MTNAPEIIPPVTSIHTYTKSSSGQRSKNRNIGPSEGGGNSGAATQELSRGWTGGEFTPAVPPPAKQQPSDGGHLAASQQAASKSKRYSSQRQRAGPDMGYSESTTDYPPPAHSPQIASVTTSLPQRPLPAATYYGMFIVK